MCARRSRSFSSAGVLCCECGAGQVEELRKKHEDSVAEKNALRDAAEALEVKLGRANALVTGLSGEKERWEVSIASFEASLVNLTGDALVAAAFLSYAVREWCGQSADAYR